MTSSQKDRLYRLLRWSERYTRLDMVYFASGSFWQTFGQVGSSALSLLLVLAFANFLPKETYGTYRYLLSLAGILNIFTLSGMSQAVAQAVAQGREGVLRTAVRYQIKWNVILMLASWVLGVYYLLHANVAYGAGLFVLSLCVPLTNAFNTYGPYLASKREFRLNNIFGVLSTLIYTLGMFAAIWLSGEVVWLVATYALTTLGATALFYFITLRRFSPPAEPAEDTLRFGRHLTYINLMAPLVGQLDSLILNHFWGAAPLAVYSVATAVPNRAVPLIKDWIDLGFPKVAQKTREEIDRTFYLRIGQGLLFGAACAAAYVLAAPYLFKYLLPQYLDAVLYTQILAVNFVFAMPNRYIGTLLTSQKMSRRIFANSLVLNIIRILSYLILGVGGGIGGLVIAQVANTALSFLVNIATWRLRSRRLSHL
jgi:O-antigen/teichoic acid export membrane protein